MISLSETVILAFEVRKYVLSWFLSFPLPNTLETVFLNAPSVFLWHNAVLVTKNNIGYSQNVARRYITTFKLRKFDLNEHRLGFFCTHLAFTPAFASEKH